MKTGSVSARSYPRKIATPAVLLLLAALTSLPAIAQTKAPSVAPATLAKYDLNKNGRLDAGEEDAMLADQARSANIPVESVSADAVPSGSAVQLSPFEVKEGNTGYLASNTMSGTRLNTKLEDLASSISVVTKQQMSDFAMLDINDIFAYEAGTEGTGNFTSFDVDRNGMVSDRIQDNPQGANRMRGISAANISLSGFATSGRVVIDPLNIDAVEISRGPNSNIFGLGEGSGTVNMVSASANLTRASTSAQLRFDDLGGWRTSLDLNRPLIRNKLALRVSGVSQHDGFVRKPSGYDTRRFNVMLRAQPFKFTTLRASFQSSRGRGTRATSMTPRDGVSDWIRNGSPTWDPVTSTVTVKGVSTAMGTINPAGLTTQNLTDPVLFVGNGIEFWGISRMPATTATNGPNNVAGTNRLLETVPEPVRDGRPLFNTLAGASSKAIYDYTSINLAAPNFLIEKAEISTVEFEQYLLDTDQHKIAFQFAWQREDADRTSRNVIGNTSATGSSYYLYVDPNSRLLDGRANPFFLRPYIGVPEPLTNESPYVRDSYRGQLAYIVDFSKTKSKWTNWLGRHQLLGYYEERKTKNFSYRYRDVMISDNPIYAPAGQPKANQSGTAGFPASPLATRGYYHYYVGDNSGYNVDYGPSKITAGNYPFSWYNAQTQQWVTDTATLGLGGVTEGTAANFASLNLIKTKGGMMQNYLFGDRLVTTFGLRNDQSLNKRQNAAALKANGYEFDFERMDGWSGDWALREGKTKTAGAVAKPFRGWKFIENARAGSGWTSHAATLLSGLSFFYNQSDSFRPETPAFSILRAELPNPTSLGKDYGFAINLGSKFSFRANKYETQQINARAGQSASIANRLLQVDLQAFAGSNRAIPLQRQARAWTSQLNPGFSTAQVEAEVLKIMQWTPEMEPYYRGHTMAETQGITAKGEEYELAFNPSSFWTLRANATRSEAVDAGLSQNIFTWLNLRMPVWETIIDPRTGNKWLDTGYAGELPSPGSLTPRSYLGTDIISPIAIARATEGKPRSQTREWRFNLSTSYRLAGMTEHRFLKNIALGGAVRWESRGAIGFWGVPVGGSYEAATELDGNRPIYDPAHAYFDGFASYSTRLFKDKIRARFQLNVKNIQESRSHLQAVGAYPNGVPHTFRIIDPRTFIFTTTFDL